MSQVETYLSQYFVEKTVVFLIKRFDMKQVHHIVLHIDDSQIDFMLENSMITRLEGGTLRMLVRMLKMKNLLQQLNELSN
jgi:hypothetical protein